MEEDDIQEDMFIDGDHNYLDEEDDIGTSPINLPDPSLFSDFHENETGEDNFEHNGSMRNNEEENEKRKLE